MPPRHLLQTIFSSLTRIPTTSTSPTRWTLLRTLKSENPNDMQGDLHGTAKFTPLRSTATPPNSAENEGYTDLLYSEEGSLPQSFGPGLRWTKKYIWRLSASGRISVWFVKVDNKKHKPQAGNEEEEEDEDEADYLFHDFDFISPESETTPASASASESGSGLEFVPPPVPPEAGPGTRVVAARGNHLCIKDMYRTAYAFRVDEESGEVLSWASRHVVRGPKKGQDIVNLYSRGL
ncbi:hypothetical protein BJX76DRAFT_351708 [Aspergillus varians]